MKRPWRCQGPEAGRRPTLSRFEEIEAELDALSELREKPEDLTEHNCINLRMPTYGGLYAWEFERGKRELKVRVDGQLVCNTIRQRLDAALAGLGLAYMVDDIAQPYIAQGTLVSVLEGWCVPFPGYHLYYASRRQSSPAFNVLVDALRYRT